VKKGILKNILALGIGVVLLIHVNILWSQDSAPPAASATESKPEEAKPEAKPDPSGESSTASAAVSDLSKDLPPSIETPTKDADPHDVALNNTISWLTLLRDTTGKNAAAINLMWTLFTGFLVMFMQAGFAMVETGLIRAKNVAHTMSMNFMIYGIGVLGFWICGFALMFGGVGAFTNFGNGGELLNHEWTLTLFGKEFGLFGYQGFFLAGKAFDSGLMALFLFQMVFMDTTATIPTGTMAERWKWSAFLIYGFFISMVIYPIYGNWVWGGGWLSKLGANFGLGHGHVDFAGSSVVHMVGGVTALAGGLIIGPRLGKYNKDGSVNALPAHNVPMYVVGTFILAFGWFGFNPGSTLSGRDLNIGRIATNTMLASAAGAFASMLYMWRVYKKPDPSFMCNGMLAGLVAITAPCAFVAPWAAVLIGACAGVLVIWSCLFFERVVKVDDPVGAISVHGVNGMWGVLSLGLFADGTYGKGLNGSHWYKINDVLRWLPDSFDKLKPEQIKDFGLTGVDAKNVVEQGVTGLFYGNSSQLAAEILGVAANLIWVFGAAYLFFWVVEKLIGNRVSAEIELQGLDVPEMGVLGYINEDPKSPEAHIIHPSAEPRHAMLPPNGKRFTVVIDGVDPIILNQIWAALCQPNQEKPPADFRTVYPHMTTLKGKVFTFRDGDPVTICEALERLIRKNVRGTNVEVRVERPTNRNMDRIPSLV